MFKLQDAQYALKVIKSVRSGYFWMEYHERDKWEPIGYTMEPCDCGEAGRALYPVFNLKDEPYYICARFGNNRHIPLPLILGDDGDAGPLQRFALRLTSRFSQAMREAEFDCAHYENQFEDEADSSIEDPHSTKD